MPLISLSSLPVREIFPGFRARLVHTDRVTHSWVDIDAGAAFPVHQHPHEQIVNVLEGELELVVDARPCVLRPGMVFVIPRTRRTSAGRSRPAASSTPSPRAATTIADTVGRGLAVYSPGSFLNFFLQEARVRVQIVVVGALVAGLGTLALGQSGTARLNPVIGLLEQGKPVFGLYAPSNRRFPPRPGTVAPAVQLPDKTPDQLAREALGYAKSDFVFDGSMEGNFERGYATFSAFAASMGQQGIGANGRLHHPLIVKAPEIAAAPDKVASRSASSSTWA
ncbi:MAG: cupin domain-containing protein [Vicinamibacterales bacterium]